MKKIIALILCIVFAVSLMPVYSNAANSGTITVSSVTVEQGKTAEITVTLSDCDCIWGALFYLVYDESLTASEFTNGDVFADSEVTAPGLNLTYNPSNTAGKLFDRLKTDMTEKKYFCFYAENSTYASNNEVSNGILFTVKLDTSAASVGTYSLDCIYDPAGGIISTDGNKPSVMNPEVNAGTLTVKSPRKLGDITGEGSVNTLDLLGLKLHLSGKKIIIDETTLAACDVTKEGKVNTLDLLRLKLFLSGKITSF